MPVLGDTVRRTFAEEKEIMTDGYHSHTGKALGADKADKEKAFCLYPGVKLQWRLSVMDVRPMKPQILTYLHDMRKGKFAASKKPCFSEFGEKNIP